VLLLLLAAKSQSMLPKSMFGTDNDDKASHNHNRNTDSNNKKKHPGSSHSHMSNY
jgi:hypothetical protein